MELSVILVNWNGIDFLPKCLNSIAENPPSVPFEIVVVDNDSSDGSVAWMRSPEAEEMLRGIPFTIIESGENLGFGRANNLGFRHTTTPFVLVLNPDTIITKGALDKLLDALRWGVKVGASAPRLLNSDGSQQFNVWDRPPDPVKIVVEGFGLSALLPKRVRSNWLFGSHFDYTERTFVPAVSGAAICVKREVLDAVGGFDDEIFMYGEDADLCLRISKAGWKILYEPQAEIMHHSGKSATQRWDDLERNIREATALMEFQKKHLSRPMLFANSLTKAFVLSVYRIRRRLLGAYDDNLDELIKVQLRYCRQSLSS